MTRAFEKFVSAPKETGIIMVIEKEYGPETAASWAKLTAGQCNVVKCTFGTGALYNEDVLKAKCKVYRDAGMAPMVGGTLTEVAMMQAGGYFDIKDYLAYAKSLGFTHVEFSDGTIYVPDDKRPEIIKMIIKAGFTVFSEVGKKDPAKDALLTTEKRVELMTKDLQAGSQMAIIEAREGGKGIGVMNKDGSVKTDELDILINAVGLNKTMVEAPDKVQQQTVFMRYGAGVSIGNVAPGDVMSASALRGGLRGDTVCTLRKEMWAKYHKSVNAPAEYNIK